MKLFLTPNPNPPYNLMTRYPAYNSQTRSPGRSDTEVLQHSIERSKAVGDVALDAPVYIVEDTELPDHYFFDAWEWVENAVKINMIKATDIHLAEIRRVRDNELAALDVPYMRAVEGHDTDAQTTIGGQKQTLRDIPQTFDLTARNPRQLKALWPLELPPRAV